MQKFDPMRQIREMGESTNNCTMVDGEVHFLSSTTINLTDKYPKFPAPIAYVDGRFVLNDLCNETRITTLENQPAIIYGSYIIKMRFLESFRNCPHHIGVHCILQDTMLAGFDYAPEYIGANLSISDTPIQSLSGIHETALQNTIIDGSIIIREDMTNILGLALIPGIKRVRWSAYQPVTIGVHTITKSVVIEVDISHNDIIRFQDDLLERGFAHMAMI